MPIVAHLSETIGLRVAGTAGQEKAAAYLEGLLRQIPGVEVEVQTASGVTLHPYRGHPCFYATKNILARIPGRESSALLLSAHYDSPPESVGAADDAAAVAVVVEMLRALATGPQLRHTIVVNLNGAEEGDLLGSPAFVDHPWIHEVRAFMNLEAAGARGKAILFQAGPGNDWLAKAYARSVPYPYGTVVGQDIFQSGLIPSDTDFRIYRDQAGLRGLDIALFQDGYAYHTSLDRIGRLEPGSVQHMGANVLALVRDLASGDLPGNVSQSPAVYYDVLGLMMLAYTPTTANVLAAIALLLAAAAAVAALRAKWLGGPQFATGTAINLAAVIAGFVLALGGALALDVLGRPHGWFATPSLAVVAFAALSLAGFVGVHALWARRGGSGEARFHTAWLSGLVGFAALLVALSWCEIGSAYLALWWTLPLALGLIGARVLPARRRVILLAACVPGALTTIQVGSLLLKMFVPVSGRMPLPIPFDPIVAALVAVPTLACALGGSAALHALERPGRSAGALGVIGVAALSALALAPPYTPERPKRVSLQHREQGEEAVVLIAGWDYPDVARALGAVPGARPSGRPFTWFPHRTFEVAATPASLPPCDLRLVSSRTDEASNSRHLVLHIDAGPATRIEINTARPVTLVLPASLNRRPPPEALSTRVFSVVAPPVEGVDIALDVAGVEPVAFTVKASYTTATPAAEGVREHLPAWTTSFAFASRIRTASY
jgi:hypothetical protein